MKELTIKNKLNDFQVDFLESKFGEVFPVGFKEFIKKYSNTAVVEDTFISDEKKHYQVSAFCSEKMMYSFIMELPALRWLHRRRGVIASFTRTNTILFSHSAGCIRHSRCCITA